MKWNDSHDYIGYQKPQKPQNHKNFYHVRCYSGLSLRIIAQAYMTRVSSLEQPVPPKVFVIRIPSMRNCNTLNVCHSTESK